MGLEPASSIHIPSPDYRNVVLVFHDYVGDWNILERRLPTYLAAHGCRIIGMLDTKEQFQTFRGTVLASSRILSHYACSTREIASF